MFDRLTDKIKGMFARYVFIITNDHIVAGRSFDMTRMYYYPAEVNISNDTKSDKVKPFCNGYINDYEAARKLLSNLLDDYKQYLHIDVNYCSSVIFPKGNEEDYQFIKEIFESKGFKKIGITCPELEVHRLGIRQLNEEEKASFIKTILSSEHEDDHNLRWEYLTEETLSATDMYYRGVGCKYCGTEVIEFEYDIKVGPMCGGGGRICVCPKCNKQQRHKHGHNY